MISKAALEMIKHHEGIRFKPYRCPAGLWTVGCGHVLYPAQGKLNMEGRLAYPLAPEDNRKFTQEEVDALLSNDLQRFVVGVLRYCPSAGSRQGWLDALVSFSFNIGLGALQQSTLRQRHNRGDYEGAADAFLRYTKGGGKVLPGLVKRRNAERLLYLS
jgi:lysozyme